MTSYKLTTEFRALLNGPLRGLFVLFTGIALVVCAMEIVGEFAAGQRVSEMLDDTALFCVALMVAAGLLIEWASHRQALAELQLQLSDARGKLLRIDHRSRRLGRQYRQLIQKQFDAWALTDSEQEIAISLLKGLSFKEVAGLRDTREKTVRQQATSIYRKAGINGRHELAAWFFEDLLEPLDP